MSRIAGRRPNASGQMMTAGCEPVAGWMKAASQVAVRRLDLTLVSTTDSAANPVLAATASPATTVVTNSRRDGSQQGLVFGNPIAFCHQP